MTDSSRTYAITFSKGISLPRPALLDKGGWIDGRTRFENNRKQWTRDQVIEMASLKAQIQVEAGRKTDDNVVCDACKARVKAGKFFEECSDKQ